MFLFPIFPSALSVWGSRVPWEFFLFLSLVLEVDDVDVDELAFGVSDCFPFLLLLLAARVIRSSMRLRICLGSKLGSDSRMVATSAVADLVALFFCKASIFWIASSSSSCFL